MLLSAQAARHAHRLLAARADAALIPPLSSQGPLSIADGYDVAKNIMDIRVAHGEVMAGRKIGFTNRAAWSKMGGGEPVSQPMWAPLFDSTVRYAPDNHGIQNLAGAQQPRLEPEVVFKLGQTPAPGASIAEVANCIEWMAHGFEIITCPYPGWKFEPADAIAAFGLHGALIIGEPTSVSPATRRNLGSVLAMSSISMSWGRDGVMTLRGAGFGSDVMDNPVHALWHLHALLQSQPQFPPLAAGEIISTGSWTDAYPIEAGQTWISAFSGVTLPGLNISFV
jgi:2-keto-4-pentenoate hydratase